MSGPTVRSATATRLAVLIDGFNLYHAIDELGRPELKWLDLRALAESFSSVGSVVAIYYFSAYATWRPNAYRKHRTYVAALETVGVQPVLGRFKEKDRTCRACRSSWKAHEEKETDVNLALYLLNEAHRDTFDAALLVSNDSDLVPAVRMTLAAHPRKRVLIATPPRKRTSKDLVTAAGGFSNVREIKPSRIERCLFPATVYDSNGAALVRPPDWDPPSPSAPGSAPQVFPSATSLPLAGPPKPK
jgi:uncharacterized LabA/DUF88 family protein